MTFLEQEKLQKQKERFFSRNLNLQSHLGVDVKRFLIVEDDSKEATAYQEIIKSQFPNTIISIIESTAHEDLRMLQDIKFDLIFLDSAAEKSASNHGGFQLPSSIREYLKGDGAIICKSQKQDRETPLSLSKFSEQDTEESFEARKEALNSLLEITINKEPFSIKQEYKPRRLSDSFSELISRTDSMTSLGSTDSSTPPNSASPELQRRRSADSLASAQNTLSKSGRRSAGSYSCKAAQNYWGNCYA